MKFDLSYSGNKRSGFTLVEMLVAVALVLLMMSMFAAIFQQAAGSVSKQRGLAENDQRARSVFSLFRADLQKRTFRDVRPFVRNESPITTPFSFAGRQGYFYISTNNPNDASDDIVQFTVNANVTTELAGQVPYYGKSAQLLPGGIALSDVDGDGDTDVSDAQILLSQSLALNPNQPEADDGEVYSNGTATSPAAEICYFLRGGNLYRRVMLVRSPLALAGQELKAQPTRATDAADLLDPDGDPLTDDALVVDLENGRLNDPLVPPSERFSFWGYFDYSAIRQFDTSGVPTTAAQFIGSDALSNEPVGSTFFSLGKPQFRFGHDPQTGYSREFTSYDSPEFMGRFLLGETAPGEFGYPQTAANFDLDGDGSTDVTLQNPMALPHTTGAWPSGLSGPTLDISLTADTRSVQVGTQELSTKGPVLPPNERRSEDLLLANVQEFKIEVWDDRAGGFVTPGYTGGVVGDFHLSRRRNSDYGPYAVDHEQANQTLGPLRLNRVFDTWHPDVIPGTVAPGLDAPFRPLAYYPPGTPDGAEFWEPSTSTSTRTYTTEDTNGNGILDAGEDANSNGVLDFDVVFPLTEDVNGDGFFDEPNEDQYDFSPNNAGQAFSADNDVLDSQVPWRGFAYYYKCVRSGDASLLANSPNWQGRPGAIISEDSDNDGVPGGPNAAVWQAVPNVRPLRAIRITLRFTDASTGQSRQLTIDHSLLD